MRSKWVQKEWQLLFICYGNQCLPGDESVANTPLLISQFLPCTPQTGDRERPELLSVKSSTVTTDRPNSPRQRTPSEVTQHHCINACRTCHLQDSLSFSWLIWHDLLCFFSVVACKCEWHLSLVVNLKMEDEASPSPRSKPRYTGQVRLCTARYRWMRSASGVCWLYYTCSF